jgi:hypothetical protein
MKLKNIWTKYSYLWITLILFLGSLIGHWLFAWSAFVSEQQMHGVPVEMHDFWIQTFRDTLENWQSEFLQLIWQVAGLSFLFSIGSPQSKEGDDRKEEKIDHILMALNKEEGQALIKRLDIKYPRK